MDKNNTNLRYCLQFLRNGGERVRAIKLCREATKMPLKECILFVDQLHEPMPLGIPKEKAKYCQKCLNYFHPDTVECPVCNNKELEIGKYYY